MRRAKRLIVGSVATASLILSPTLALATTAGNDAAIPAGNDAAAPTTETQAGSDVVVLDLYNLTDIHGHIEQVTSKDKQGNVKVTEAGLSAMSCYVKRAKTQNPNSQLLLLGDNIGASPFTSGSQHDNPTIKALNQMGVFASTIGNHEFDKGQDVLRARFTGGVVDGVTYEKVGFPYLGANVHGLTGLGSYEVWTSPSGVKVAFIGAIEDDADTKVFPGTFAGMTFSKPVPVINDLAKQIKTKGEADVVIAMYDNDVERSYPKMGEYVDGIMGGDTHKPYYFTKVATESGHVLSATASGSFTDNLSNLQITYDKKTGKVIDSQAVQISAAEVATCGDDPAVKAVVDEAKAAANEAGSKVIADGAGNFSRGYQKTIKGEAVTRGENRGTESTIGGLIADAMHETFTTLEGTPIDIGIINAGGIRADLLPKDGKVTVADVFKVQPFSNEVGYVKMTGAQFKTLLEQQWKELGKDSSRPMLKLGLSKNVSYTFDPTKPRGERVTSILIDGKPIDPAATYSVASVTFLLSGGDSFDVLKDPAIATTLTTIPNKLDRDVFGSYLEKNPKVQPRAAKQSVGVSIAADVSGNTASAKVALRGLSFSGEGEARTDTVTVKLGDVTATAKVNNTLEDANAANENAIVTADGVGYLDAPVSLSATAQCTTATTVHLPLTVTSDTGAVLVGEAAGLGVDVACTPAGGSQDEGGSTGGEQPGTQCAVMDRPATPPRATPPHATGKLGEATGDSFADLWFVDGSGTVHFYAGNSEGFYRRGVVMCGPTDIVDLAAMPDLNGDGRADVLARYANGDAYYMYSSGEGFLTKGVKAGHGWAGMDNVSYAGKLGSSGDTYVVARQVATGDLYRYTVSRSGLHSGVKIGHGWGSMRFVLAPGQFTGSALGDLVAIRDDGAMFAYAGATDGRVYSVGQIGHGWQAFTHASIPGDINGDGTFDLVAVRNDGAMFSYSNKGNGWWGPAKQVGHGWSRIGAIS